MRFLWIVAALGLGGCITESNPSQDQDGAVNDARVPAQDQGPPADGGGCTFALLAAPEAVDFGRVPAFETSESIVVFRNSGTCPLSLAAVRIDGPRTFGVTINGVDPRVDPSVLAAPLAVGDTLAVTVRFSPTSLEPSAGTLVVDSAAGAVSVPLTGDQGGACVRIEPAVLEFRAVPGGDALRLVRILSCGDEAVRVEAALLQQAQAVFEYVPDPNFGLPATLQSGAETTLAVRFRPPSVGTFDASLVLTTDVPETPRLTVRLLGQAAENACPVASVGSVDVVRVAQGEGVALDGSASRDADGPDGRPLTYTWVVLSRPDGSSAQVLERLTDNADPEAGGPADNTATAGAIWVPDLAGRYVLELRVEDLEACESTAQIVVEAGTGRALQVQLTWVGAADLDLHLHHPEGAFDSGPLDCWAGNPTPDWRPEDDAGGDPTLDRDDRAGGPENIILTAPEATAAGYGVGVVLDGFGAAEATIRIFVNGGLVWEGSMTLDADLPIWQAARVTWPDGGVRPYAP